MRVDDFAIRELDGRVERSARVRWAGGEERLSVSVPAGLEAPEHDATAFLAACLLPAMLRGEELEIDGAVSPRLLAASTKLRAIYATWLPGLGGGAVTASGELDPVLRGERIGCFISRGVDSSYSATRERDPELTDVVFVDGIEPMRNAEGRREEVRRVAAVAELMSLPLVVVETNIKRLIDPLITDGSDMMAAMLAFAAHSLAGRFGTLVIPASGSFMALSPAGTHPLLDPLYSSESVAIEHDDIELTRYAKVQWLVDNRPDLLPHIKVCYSEDRPDNCGRCLKCLLTMAALQGAGGLHLADGFPDELDLGLLDAATVDPFEWIARFGANATAHALAPDGEQGRTREALLGLLRRADPNADPYEQQPTNLRLGFAYAMTSIGLDGRPYPPLPDVPRGTPRSYTLGLVRSVDRHGARHLYGVGSRPPGELVGELGALVDGPGEGRVPVWLDEHGRLHAPGYSPEAPDLSRRLVARWLLAPLSWRGVAPLGRRARALPQRLRILAVGRPPTVRHEGNGAEPSGFLHADDAHGRIPLWSAVHPVTGDQLLCSSWEQLNGMGYVHERLLGWLEPRAPVTGRLGPDAPFLPWVSHFGRRATQG